MDSPNKDNSQEKVPASDEKDSTKVPILLRDFVADMLTSFPEIRESMDSYVLHSLSVDSIENEDNEDMSTFVNYVKEVYPPRFFDILYKNEEIFSPDSDANVHFLPGINFKDIWNISDITDTLKETIWKYLQVIMLSVINDVSSHDSFGDTAKLFEAINEDDLKTKLQETMNTLQEAMGENGLFGEDKAGGVGGESNEDDQEGKSSSSRASSSGMPDLPLPEEIHDHINGLLQGNLGRLATEIAEETAEEFDFDMDGVDSVNDVFQKMFRDPGKIMGLVKNIGSKLDSKIKEKDMSQADLMKEATDMMSKMKDMPGMGNISSMFKNMGMDVNDMASMASMASSMGGNIPGLKAALGGGKLNLGAMQASLERNMESAKKIEQMKKRIEYKKADALKQQAYKEEKQRERDANHVELNDEELEELIFSIEGSEQASKTSRFPENSSKQKANGGKKKKKKVKK